MPTSPKMGISWVKNALRIKVRLKDSIALNLKTAHQWPKCQSPTISAALKEAWNGQTTEKHMMKEILRNGVLNTEFQAPSIFATYSSGILTQGSI